MEHFLWVEKYRPQTLKDIVLDKETRDYFENCVKTQQIPNLLLFGEAPGVGKSSLAKILLKEISCDAFEFNASDHNSVEYIRNEVKNFCTIVGFEDLKVVLLTEADGLSAQAQGALKDITEEYSKSTRFIFTLNNVGKIIDPILSRCSKFEFKAPPKKFVEERVLFILKQEQVKYELKTVQKVIDLYYPDMRSIINTLQTHTIDSTLVLQSDQVQQLDVKAMIVVMLSEKWKWEKIFEYIKSQTIVSFIDVMKTMFDNVEQFSPKGKESECLLVIAEHMYRDAIVIDHQVNFMALVLNLLEIKK